MSAENPHLFLSPVGLLIALYLALYLAMPLGTWQVLRGHRDDKLTLWFAGLCCFCTGAILISLRPILPPLLSYQTSWLLACIAGLLVYESFRREAGLPNSSGVTPSIVLIAYCILHAFVYFSGKTVTLGVLLNSTGVLVFCVMLFVLAGRLHQKVDSRSLRIMQFALVFWALPSGARPLVYFWTGDAHVINSFEFSWMANWLNLAYIVSPLFLCIGYWGFVLEKSIRERNVAALGKRKAEGLAAALQRLVEERNHLLVINSRFSTINELGSLSAMVVHDLAQPVQRLTLTIARMNLRLRRSAVDPALQEGMRQLEEICDETIEAIGALRNLVGKDASDLCAVPLGELMDRLRSVMASEVRAREVTLDFSMLTERDVAVKSIQIMLQRILINVVNNALEALAAHPVAKPRVHVSTRMQRRNDREGVEICIEDNGPGFPAEFLERVLSPWSSSKVHGLGLGLMLANSLVKSWGGEMVMRNRGLKNGDDPGEQGAQAIIWLPMAEPEADEEEVFAPGATWRSPDPSVATIPLA